jgi:hypothetical protein
MTQRKGDGPGRNAQCSARAALLGEGRAHLPQRGPNHQDQDLFHQLVVNCICLPPCHHSPPGIADRPDQSSIVPGASFQSGRPHFAHLTFGTEPRDRCVARITRHVDDGLVSAAVIQAMRDQVAHACRRIFAKSIGGRVRNGVRP